MSAQGRWTACVVGWTHSPRTHRHGLDSETGHPVRLSPLVSYQPAAARSRAVRALLIVWMVTAMALIVANLLRLNLVNSIAAGQPVSVQDAAGSDSLVTNVARLSVGVYVLAAIALLMWLHRVVRNNHVLGERYLRFSPALAVGCWFIPFANLVLPFQAVREAWGAADPELPSSTPDTRNSSRGSGLVVAWWLTFILGSLVGLASIGYGPNSGVDAFTRVRAATYITVVQEALHIAAALLLIAVVMRLTTRQEQKSSRVQAIPYAASASPPSYGDVTPAPTRPAFMPACVSQYAGLPPPPAPPPSPPEHRGAARPDTAGPPEAGDPSGGETG